MISPLIQGKGRLERENDSSSVSRNGERIPGAGIFVGRRWREYPLEFSSDLALKKRERERERVCPLTWIFSDILENSELF